MTAENQKRKNKGAPRFSAQWHTSSLNLPLPIRLLFYRLRISNSLKVWNYICSHFVFVYQTPLPKKNQGEENLMTEQIKVNKPAQRIQLCSLLIGWRSRSEQHKLRERDKTQKRLTSIYWGWQTGRFETLWTVVLITIGSEELHFVLEAGLSDTHAV